MGQRGFRFSSEVKTNYIVIVAFIVLALLAVYIVYENPNRSSFRGRRFVIRNIFRNFFNQIQVKVTNYSGYKISVRVDGNDIKESGASYNYINHDSSTTEFYCSIGDTITIQKVDSNDTTRIYGTKKEFKVDSRWNPTELNSITIEYDWNWWN